MTGIEWTEETWNPTTGCDRVSPGCDNCYALTLAKRLKGMGAPKYQRDGDPQTSGPGFGITEHPDALRLPLTWRKPRKVFVNSMSDLFHAGVSDEFIARVWAVMAATPQHTYQILTKRHGRMRSLLGSPEFVGAVTRELWESLDLHPDYLDTLSPCSDYPAAIGHRPWPLSNVWLGVSVEDQQRADLRIPALLDTPAAVRFLSCEPMLGRVDLAVHLAGYCAEHDFPGGFCVQRRHPGVAHLGWVIVGGESGPGARPMDLAWAHTIVTHCANARVPVFVKQLGSVWDREHGRRGKGGDPGTWPADLHVREWPTTLQGVPS